MRAKRILHLCCILTLLLAGAAPAAETGPALTVPVFDDVAPAPVCSAPGSQDAQADLGGGSGTEASSASVSARPAPARTGACKGNKASGGGARIERWPASAAARRGANGGRTSAIVARGST
jgi:hypothetical protein